MNPPLKSIYGFAKKNFWQRALFVPLPAIKDLLEVNYFFKPVFFVF